MRTILRVARHALASPPSCHSGVNQGQSWGPWQGSLSTYLSTLGCLFFFFKFSFPLYF